MRTIGISFALALGLAIGSVAGPTSQEDEPASTALRSPDPRAVLDTLSDGEHLGFFIGHVVGLGPEIASIRGELASLPPPTGDVDTWLGDLVDDPQVAAAYLSGADRWVRLFEAESAWLDAHPARACWADAHDGWRAWVERAASTTQDLAAALRARDGESLLEADAALEAFSAEPGPDIFALGGACWSSPLSAAADRARAVSLDALSDAEHFGVFMGHSLGIIPTLEQLRDVPYPVPESGTADSWLAELRADPTAVADYLALLDRLAGILEEELAWLETHPPRPCWAGVHEAYTDWYRQADSVVGALATAIGTDDAARLGLAYSTLKVLEARDAPDLYASGLTCWPGTG